MSTNHNAQIAAANAKLLAKINRRLDKVVIEEEWAPETLEDKATHVTLTKTEKRDHKVWSHRAEPTTRLLRKGVWSDLPKN